MINRERIAKHTSLGLTLVGFRLKYFAKRGFATRRAGTYVPCNVIVERCGRFITSDPKLHSSPVTQLGLARGRYRSVKPEHRKDKITNPSTKYPGLPDVEGL
jgi:hypothetical protein